MLQAPHEALRRRVWAVLYWRASLTPILCDELTRSDFVHMDMLSACSDTAFLCQRYVLLVYLPVLRRCASDLSAMREAKRSWEPFVMTREPFMTTSALATKIVCSSRQGPMSYGIEIYRYGNRPYSMFFVRSVPTTLWTIKSPSHS